MKEIDIQKLDPGRFDGVLEPEPARRFAHRLEGRPIGSPAVVLHDPQTVGLAPELKRLGATVVWSCHVGVDRPNDLARTAWEFLRPYVQAADAYVFSRSTYCWEGRNRERMAVIPPCIDAFAPRTS